MEGTRSACILASWDNVNPFAIPTKYPSQFSAFLQYTTLSFCHNPLEVAYSIPSGFAYYSGLAHDHWFRRLINVIARSKGAICVLESFFSAASRCYADIFKFDSRLMSNVLRHLAISAPLVDLFSVSVYLIVEASLSYIADFHTT